MSQRDDRKSLQPLVPVSPASQCSLAAEPEPDANRRARSRVETQHAASVRLGSVSYTVELRDVSRTGARIEIRRGLMPAIGQYVELQFLNDTVALAIVVWTSETCAGLQFVEELPEGFDAVHFDDLGSEYFRAVLRLQICRA